MIDLHKTNPRIHSLQLNNKCNIDVFRLDEIHAFVSGNKFYKLYNYMQECLKQKAAGILTFGGGFSNHLAATAYYCNQQNQPCVGIVSGDYSTRETPTINFCKAQNMEIVYTDKANYQEIKKGKQQHFLLDKYKYHFVIPEGGYGVLGAKGIQDLFANMSLQQYTHVVVPVGTGTSIAGIANALYDSKIKIYGFVPMKNNNSISNEIDTLLHHKKSLQISLFYDFHFGGFGKTNDELLLFMKHFVDQNKFHLDKVYTAKAMYGLIKLCQKGEIVNGDQVLFVHTGGLQGNGN